MAQRKVYLTHAGSHVTAKIVGDDSSECPDGPSCKKRLCQKHDYKVIWDEDDTLSEWLSGYQLTLVKE